MQIHSLMYLQDLADEKKLPFNTAVEVSYLRTEEQQILLQYMSNHNMVPSMKQAKELKQISKKDTIILFTMKISD